MSDKDKKGFFVQQAHHIIPVNIFKGEYGKKIQELFKLDNISDFQQMGGNFIYLHSDEHGEAAKNLQALLADSDNNNLFGDVTVGGAWHRGSHPSYDDVVEGRLRDIFDDTSSTPEQKQRMILDLQRGLKEMLIDGTPNVMQADQFSVEDMNDYLDGKGKYNKRQGIYSPTNPDDTNAQKLLTEFNSDAAQPIEKQFLTRKFDNSGTDGIAKYTGSKILKNIGELNKATQFISDTGQTYFDKEGTFGKDKIDNPSEARQLIYHTTYDVERFLTAADVFKDENGQSSFKSNGLDNFLSEFKQVVSQSLTDETDPAEILKSLESLESKKLDAKAVKLMADLRTEGKNGKVFLDFDGIDEKTEFKNSILWDVLDHIENNNDFDEVVLNGKKVSDWKATTITDVNGNTKSANFKQLVYQTAVIQTEITRMFNDDSTFDRSKFKDFSNQVSTHFQIVNNQLNLTPEQDKLLTERTKKLNDLYSSNVGELDKQVSSLVLKNMANDYLQQAAASKPNSKVSIQAITLSAIFLVFSGKALADSVQDSKTEDEAKQKIIDFAFTAVAEEIASTAAEFGVQRLISAAVGAGLVTVSAPVAATAALVAGIVAGMYGEDIYQLTKDLDGNGKMDFVDRMSTLMFGQDIKPNEIPEILNRQLHTNFATKKVDLTTNMSVADFVAKAKEDIAYRYALQELNPFVIEGANYDAFNQDGSLNLLDGQNPQGMSEQYLTDRATMLLLQLQYLQNGLKLGRDLDSFGIKGDWDYLDYGKHPFAGEPDSPLVFSIDGNGISTDDHIIAFGTKEDDTFTGSDKGDRFYGGAGKDTFESSADNDYMEGGVGFDVYHIKDQDIIFDSDMEGQILFDGRKLDKVQFERTDVSGNEWRSVDKAHKPDDLFKAVRVDNDLLIMSLKDEDNQVTIKDFFSFAKNQSDSPVWRGLGITLSDYTDKAPHDMDNYIIGKTNKYNQFNVYDKVSVGVTSGEKDDVIFMAGTTSSSVIGLGGNDLIIGGTNADILEGSDGHDIIYGSGGLGTNLAADQRVLDADVIVGGAGRDLINGGAGNDIIHTGERYEHLETNGTNERGDWAAGGIDDDKVYGSQERDFLMGSEGADIVHGGASDDVIVGDAFIRAGNQINPINVPPGTTYINYTPIYGGIGGLNAELVSIPHNAITAEFEFRNGTWGMKPTYAASARHKNNDNWDIAITENGDYTLTHKVALGYDLHLTEFKKEFKYDDSLYGGTGNDLLVGQWGNDHLWGGEGNDILWGDDNRDTSVLGNDHLYGGAGNDKLYAGDGDDLLSGGTGNDTLDGGNGFDTYVFKSNELNGKNIIKDADHQGMIMIDDVILGDLVWKLDQKSQTWSSAGHEIYLKENKEDSKLLILNGENVAFATIEQFNNGNLGIRLKNQAPVINEQISSQNAIEATLFEHSFSKQTFTDEDPDNLTYTVTLADGSPLPNWLQFNSDSLTLTGTPTREDVGLLELKITATDKEGLSNEQTWSMNIAQKPNEAPILNTEAVITSVVKENTQQTISYANWFNDDGGADKLRYELKMANGSALPKWLSDNNQQLHINPDFEMAGLYSLRLTATDEDGLSNSIEWNINVDNVNRAPTVSGNLETQSLRVGENWQYTLPISFKDADLGETEQLVYRLAMSDGSIVPDWLKYNERTQTLSGTADVVGNLNVSVIATDPHGDQVIAPITLNIQDLPKPPPVTTPTQPSQPITPVIGTTKIGSRLNDVLIGTDGDDTLNGGRGLGKDTLTGGKGNDTLIGGDGNDTYVFNAGDGHDRIFDAGGKDNLKINGLALSDVLFQRDGRNLIIKSVTEDDSITVERYFFSEHPIFSMPNIINPFANVNKIDVVTFDNGQSITYSQIDKLVQFDNLPHHAIL